MANAKDHSQWGYKGGPWTERALQKMKRLKAAEDPAWEDAEFVEATDPLTGDRIALPVVNQPIPKSIVPMLRAWAFYGWKSSMLVASLEDTFAKIVRYAPQREQKQLKDRAYYTLLMLKIKRGGEVDVAVQRLVANVRQIRDVYRAAGKESLLPGPFDFGDFPPPGLFDDYEITAGAQEYFSKEDWERLKLEEEVLESWVEDEARTDWNWGSRIKQLPPPDGLVKREVRDVE